MAPQARVSDRIGDEVCRYIVWHWKSLGFPPTIRDIQVATNVKSTSTIHNCLIELELDGRITRDPYRRTVSVVPGENPALCDHDWRITNADCIDTREALVECFHCHHRTAVEFAPDWENLATCPRFTGEVR